MDNDVEYSIVVPTYNDPINLRRCLQSLQHQQGIARDDWEVLVVDNGSEKRTSQAIEAFQTSLPLRYLYIPRTSDSNRSRARNRAIRAARGEVIIMIDGDQIAAPNVVALHRDAHRAQHDIAAVGSRSRLRLGAYDDVMLSQRFATEAMPPIDRIDIRDRSFGVLGVDLEDLETAWHYFWSMNASVRRSALLDVGLFDESFRGWGLEDSELGYRLGLTGVAFRHLRDAVVYHPHMPPSPGSVHAQWRSNLGRFCDKHGSASVEAQREFDLEVDSDRPWHDRVLAFENTVRRLRHREPLMMGASMPQLGV